MTFKDLFSGVSLSYAAFRPRYPDRLFELLAELAPRRTLAWDCATGSGQAAVPLARWFERVIATDASAEQLAHAHAHARVEYRRALAEVSTIDAGTVDLITVAQAAHWFDLERFYAEARRVAAPGAAIALWTYTLMRCDARVDHAVHEYAERVAGPYWPPERRLVDEEYRTIPFPFAELALPPLDITAELSLEDLVGYLRTWSATTRLIDARGEEPFRDAMARIATVWGDVERRPITWPLILRVGRIERG